MRNIYHGVNGDLIIEDNQLIIKRGFKGIVFGNDSQVIDNKILFNKIIKVKYEKAQWFRKGYILIDCEKASESWLIKMFSLLGYVILFFFPKASIYSIVFNKNEDKKFLEVYSFLNKEVNKNKLLNK